MTGMMLRCNCGATVNRAMVSHVYYQVDFYLEYVSLYWLRHAHCDLQSYVGITTHAIMILILAR